MYKKRESHFLKTSYIIFICFIFLLTSFSFFAIFILNKDGGLLAAYANKNVDAGDISAIAPQNEEPVVNDEAAQEIANLQKDIDYYEKALASDYLKIVNANFPLPDDYNSPTLVDMTSNPAYKMESIAAMKLQEFIDAATTAGYKSVLISCYRDNEEQKTLYNKTVQDNMSAGYTVEESELMTQKAVARPGQSESQTGLAVNIAENKNMTVDEMEASDFYQYAIENIHKYGFILRYPKDKEHITGYEFDPSYFRYVGDVEHSTYIYEKKLTLDEYVDYLKQKKIEANQRLTSLLNNQNGA